MARWGMRAYSSDLRAKVLAAVDAGMSKCAASRLFGIDDDTIRRWAKQRQETGSLDPRPHPGRRPLIRPEQREVLWAQLVEHPTAILAEHCALWEQQTGVRVGITAMHEAIKRLRWTRKKDRWVPPSETRSSAAPGGTPLAR
jgi:transposase